MITEEKIDQAHWDVAKDGHLKGIWDIDVSQAQGADMWAKIHDIIVAYTKVHGMEVELTVRQNKEQQKWIFNDYAASTDKGGSNLRWGCSLPPGLLFKIQALYPEVFSNRITYRKFLKKFPGFSVAKRI